MSSFTVLTVFPDLQLQAPSLASSHSGFYAPSKSGRYSSRNGGSSQLGLTRRSSSVEAPLNRSDIMIRSCGEEGNAPPPLPSMERREMLAASLLTATTSLFLQPSAFAASSAVQPPPNVSACVAPTSDGKPLPFLTELDYCMGLGGKNIIPTVFQFPAVSRVRKRAHKMTSQEMADYNEAYRRMRALPDTDPRSLRRQGAIHAAFCNFVYRGRQGQNNFLSMHGNDLFPPWHRFYLYFHERILADLLGKPTFALPYWNWDDQVEGGNTMPNVFVNQAWLRNGINRNQAHVPPTIVDLGWPSGGRTPPSNITTENTSIVHKAVVNAKTPGLFMGSSFLSTESPGTLESLHNTTHEWTGDPKATRPGEDMGHLYSAGRDPIFYAHHSNVDRLWSVWEKLPGVNTNTLYQNSDFRNSSFVFFDEKSNLVTVSVKDCLTQSSKLNISYEAATRGDNNWINYKPQASRQNLGKPQDRKIASTRALQGPLPLIDTISTLVSAPPSIAQNRILSQVKQPILVLENVRLFMRDPISFAVFINFPDANSETGLDCAEFVGLYTNIRHLDMDGMTGPSNITLKFPLGESLEILNLDVNSPLTVTVVARSPIKNPLTIGGFSIVYE